MNGLVRWNGPDEIVSDIGVANFMLICPTGDRINGFRIFHAIFTEASLSASSFPIVQKSVLDSEIFL